MARLIDADALKENLRESYDSLRKIYDGLRYNSERAICGGQLTTFLEDIMRIMEAPTIEAEPVKHGRWGQLADNEGWAYCSECHCCWEWEIIESCNINYCPNCGAKMDLED